MNQGKIWWMWSITTDKMTTGVLRFSSDWGGKHFEKAKKKIIYR